MTIDDLIDKYEKKAHQAHVKHAESRKNKHDNLKKRNLSEAKEDELDQVFWQTESTLYKRVASELREFKRCGLRESIYRR